MTMGDADLFCLKNRFKFLIRDLEDSMRFLTFGLIDRVLVPLKSHKLTKEHCSSTVENAQKI